MFQGNIDWRSFHKTNYVVHNKMAPKMFQGNTYFMPKAKV